MSRYEKVKLVLWGFIAGLLLVQLMHSLPAGAADRELVGRYRLATAVAGGEGGAIERSYVIDTATGRVVRFHAPPSAPMTIMTLGEKDLF
ncbi:MAG: hypothetical protein GF330_13005 [Candidatus Eisenbacteria bacterium]|nr:hypothetical protein [Candidatus Eisenbacteria bacterium]